MTQRFAYAIDQRYLPLLVPFGLRGSKDGVILADDGTFLATFGFLKLQTALANVTGAHITRWATGGGRRSVSEPRPSMTASPSVRITTRECAFTSWRRSHHRCAGADIQR